MTELRRKPEVDYYKVLQVDADAEPEVIDAAYRALSKKYHPDVNRAPDAMNRMAQINLAYNVLSDPSKRRDYNYLRSGGIRSASASSTSTARPATNVNPVVDHEVTRPGKKSSETQNSGSVFNPQSQTPPRPSTSSTTQKTGPVQNGSFRPQNSYPGNGNGAEKPKEPRPAASKAPAGSDRSGLNFQSRTPRKSRLGLGLVTLLVIGLLVVGGALFQEVIVGNPLKTNFIKQPPATVAAPGRGANPLVTPSLITPQSAIPTNREQVLAFLNNPELYAGRVSDVNLVSSDTLQIKLRLASNGTVLNSDSIPPNRVADELDILRQAEATTYNLVYSLFGRFQEANRLNLMLTDSKDRLVYRADVDRAGAYSFFPWHSQTNSADSAEASKNARQDRLVFHFGTPLDDSLRTRLNAPSESNIQAELQTIGLSAFSVTASPQLTINYFQVRSEAETAVDFTKIIYTLYTRFPALDKLQIVASGSPEKPVKVIDRQLFQQTGLEVWAQASYGGSTAGGDRQARSLIASLPGNLSDLKQLPVTIQARYKTPVQVGTWAVVTENVERFDSLALDGLRFAAGKDRQFLVVRVALRNGSDGRQWLMPGERMSLMDTRGPTNYASDPAATLLYVLRTPPSPEGVPGPLDSNKQGAVYVVFNVPANTNLATLRLQFQDADKKAQLELS